MSHVQLHIIYLNETNIDSFLSSSLLNDADRNSINQVKMESRKKEAAASFYLKRKYVGDFYLDKYGKPQSDKIHFNISHTDGYIVIALSDKPVGVDIEVVKEMDNSIVKFISSEQEYDAIHNNVDAIKLWTNKEALLKAVGIGLRCLLNEVPGLPFNKVKKYRDKEYFTITTEYLNSIISIARETSEPFEISIEKEAI